MRTQRITVAHPDDVLVEHVTVARQCHRGGEVRAQRRLAELRLIERRIGLARLGPCIEVPELDPQNRGLQLIESIPDAGAIIVDAHNQVHISKRMQGLVRIVHPPTPGI